MKQTAKALAVIVGLVSCADALFADEVKEKYANYYAATRALDRGDCRAVVDHLEAFLSKNPEVRTKFPDFYFQVRLVMGQCSGSISVRGVEGESEEIDPLPEHPPVNE